MSNDNRPMSPHLDIYRWRITMLTSTLHRLSGVFICFGFVIFSLWLACISTGKVEGAGGNLLIPVFWFIWTAAVYYHLCNGIRHLLWDAGKGFGLDCAEKSGKMVFVATAVLTLLTWIIAV